VAEYVEALRTELAERAGTRTFETIYLGGGTPTVLPGELLTDLVRRLASRLDRSGGAPEFTIEANPGTIDRPLLERLAAEGVTRLSLGVQSFGPALRAALGRRVAQEEIVDALAAIAAVGWQEWNLDLVFGIPGQTWDDARADLDTAVAAAPSHMSLYDLTYTPAFSARVETTLGAGARRAAGAFAEEHYAGAVARLQSAGYRRYEVSNFALPGHECRHNQAYWRGEDYLGVGASAVSTVGLVPTPGVGASAVSTVGLVPTPGVGASAVSTLTVAAPERTGAATVGAPSPGAPHSGGASFAAGAPLAVSGPAAERRTNPCSVAGYLAGEAPRIEVLSPVTRLWERAMLGLRTTEGVDESSVLAVLDPEARDRLLAQGCLERRYGKLRLNPGFLDISNAVIGALLADPGE